MPPTPSASTGANVRAEMARKGYSQAELARMLGMSQTGISKRLRGETPFDVNELARISAVLGVPLGTLLDGVGSAA